MIKTPAEIEIMAEAGRLLASVFTWLDDQPLAGRTTMDVNDAVERLIVDQLQARPASKGQYGYGFVLNCSINHVVCHGVPSTQEVLREGDIVNFDITLEKGGYIADSSKTYMIGDVTPAARRLVKTTYDALWQGIGVVRPGARLGDVLTAVAHEVSKAGRTGVYDINVSNQHGAAIAAFRGRSYTMRGQPLVELVDVARQDRLQVSVDDGRRQTVVLADLRYDLGRHRHVHARQLFGGDHRHALFMLGMQEREQQAHGERFQVVSLEVP